MTAKRRVSPVTGKEIWTGGSITNAELIRTFLNIILNVVDFVFNINKNQPSDINEHLISFRRYAEECDTIIETYKSRLQKAKVVDENNPITSGKYNEKDRKSDTYFIPPDSESEWIFRKLTDYIINANDNYFHFDLHGFEKIQFTRYKSSNDCFKNHVDAGPNDIRKLSLSIQLSDPKEYEGGELCINDSPDPQVCPNDLGTIILFPSYTSHEVKPVTKGTRYSLVAWVEGPPFR